MSRKSSKTFSSKLAVTNAQKFLQVRMFKLQAPGISGFEFVKHGILISLGLLSTFLCMLNSLGLYTTILVVQHSLRIKISANNSITKTQFHNRHNQKQYYTSTHVQIPN